MDLWTVRSLTFQRTHSQKRRRLTSNLYLQEDDDDEPTTKSWLSYIKKISYLGKLQILVTGTVIYQTCTLRRINESIFAIVGCRPVEPAPTAPESLGSDSLIYVQVPYDVLLTYSSRCHDLVLRTPEGKRLQLLQHLDVEGRGQWAPRCTGNTTLGTILSAVMRERDALWLAGALPAPSIATGAASGGAASAPAPPAAAGQVGSVDTAGWDTAVPGLPAQSVPRQQKNCPRGAHRCGVALQSGRVCGSFQHSPTGCPKAA